MIEIGTRIMRTESELVLKSRRAVPTLLLRQGYQFAFPTWPEAARDLVGRTKSSTITR
jgi:NAD dependent epimerase/dehydratase family enzyme